MRYDQATAARVRRLLTDRQDVVEKRMIGGLCFMVHGSMCCGVTGTGLIVRVGPEAMAWALAQPHLRPMEFGGRATAAFVIVEPAGYQTDTDLAGWIQRGIDCVAELPPTKRTPVKRRPARP